MVDAQCLRSIWFMPCGIGCRICHQGRHRIEKTGIWNGHLLGVHSDALSVWLGIVLNSDTCIYDPGHLFERRVR